MPSLYISKTNIRTDDFFYTAKVCVCDLEFGKLIEIGPRFCMSELTQWDHSRIMADVHTSNHLRVRRT